MIILFNETNDAQWRLSTGASLSKIYNTKNAKVAFDINNKNTKISNFDKAALNVSNDPNDLHVVHGFESHVTFNDRNMRLVLSDLTAKNLGKDVLCASFDITDGRILTQCFVRSTGIIAYDYVPGNRLNIIFIVSKNDKVAPYIQLVFKDANTGYLNNYKFSYQKDVNKYKLAKRNFKPSTDTTGVYKDYSTADGFPFSVYRPATPTGLIIVRDGMELDEARAFINKVFPRATKRMQYVNMTDAEYDGRAKLKTLCEKRNYTAATYYLPQYKTKEECLAALSKMDKDVPFNKFFSFINIITGDKTILRYKITF